MFDDVLHRLAIGETNSGVSCGDGVAATGVEIRSMNPATGEALPIVRAASAADYDRVVNRAAEVFEAGGWSRHPAAARLSASSAWPCGAEERSWAPGHARDGKDPYRGGRRSPGDD